MPDEEYSLVMPFVTVDSVGGPHDDASYVAGWEMGHLDATLALCEPMQVLPEPRMLRAVNLPQVDLIAMKYGLVSAVSEVEGAPDWRSVRFTRAEASDPDV